MSLRFWALALGLFCIAALWLGGASRAEEAGDLYESPTLAIDPGRPTGTIRSLSVDAAGEFAVTGGYDRMLRVWRVASGELARTIPIPLGPGNVGRVDAVAISPDGKLIAAGGWTGHYGHMPLYLFERETGRLVARVGADMENVALGLAFSPDGRYLAATLGGGFGLRVFDARADWAQAYRADAYGGDSYGVAFSGEGRLVTTSYDGYLRFYGYDPRAEAPGFHPLGKPMKAPGGHQPSRVAFSPDGQRLAVGYLDAPAIDVLDARTQARLGPKAPANVHMGPEGLFKVAWSRDGQTVFAGGSTKYADNRFLLFAWGDGGLGAERRSTYCGDNTVAGIATLDGGAVLVASQLPCLGRMDATGKAGWTVGSPVLDLRNQETRIGLSRDGEVVDFWRNGDERRIRFDAGRLKLSAPAADDRLTAPPLQTPLQNGAEVKGWDWPEGRRPTLGGEPLPIQENDTAFSLAVAPDAPKFYLGSSFAVTAFDAARAEKWRVSTASGIAWAVNASGDGRLVVVAYADGSIRWLRAADGVELLALQVLPNDGAIGTWGWVLWTPEGYYQAEGEGEDALRWVVNHGPDTTPTVHPVSQFKYLNQPAALKLVLDNLETARALGLAKITEDRFEVQKQTGSARPAGGVLHVMAVGVSKFGPKAGSLHLDFAAQDAKEVWNALLNSQTPGPKQASRFAGVAPNGLFVDEDANKKSLLRRLDQIADSMKSAAEHNTPDTAVIFITTHGEMIGHGQSKKLFLMTYGVDLSTGDDYDITQNALSVDELAGKIAEIGRSGQVLVLLDACHSGALSGEVDVVALTSALDPDLKDNIAVLTSTKTKGEEAHELPDYGHSAFTQALLDALRQRGDANGIITLAGFVDSIGRELEQLTRTLPPPKQRLGAHTNSYGDLFVANPF